MTMRIYVYTKLELRGVIRFLWAQGKRPAQIYREMTAVYGDDFMSLENVCKWVAQFADKRTSLDDSSNSGRPRTVITPGNMAQVQTLIQEDRRRTVKSIAVTLDMSYGSVYDILHDALGYRKVAARWVPRSLTADHKAVRMMTCLDHLETYRHDGTTFLESIVTGDETWAHHFIPESKQASMVWKHPWSPQ
jgi:transposase